MFMLFTLMLKLLFMYIDLMFDFGDSGDVSVALDVDFNIEVWSSYGNQGLARSLKLKLKQDYLKTGKAWANLA